MRAFNFKLGEEEVVAADTIIEAIRFYCKNCGWSIDDSEFDDGDIEEIPKDKWATIQVTNFEYDSSDPEDKEMFTLAELMEGVVTPEIVTTSVY